MHDYYLSYPSKRGEAYRKLCTTLARLGAMKITDSCYYIQSKLELEQMRHYLIDMLERDESACLIFAMKYCGMAHSKLF